MTALTTIGDHILNAEDRFAEDAKEEIKGRDNVIEEEVDIDDNKVKNDGAVHNLMHSKDTKGGDQMVEVILCDALSHLTLIGLCILLQNHCDLFHKLNRENLPDNHRMRMHTHKMDYE